MSAEPTLLAATSQPAVVNEHAPPPQRLFRQTPLGNTLAALLRFSASLKLAIGLLSLFTLCLVLATLIESAYGGRIARELVYGTWWFALVLVLLAVNILGAAVKKFPWKRHQTGFLITHAGLLVLVFGGLLTSLGGTEGQMLLVDTDDRELQHAYHLSNQADMIQLVDQHQLDVVRVPPGAHEDEPLLRDVWEVAQGGVEIDGRLRDRLKGHTWSTTFRPGSLPWHGDDRFQPRTPWGLSLLRTLADPSPAFGVPLDGRVSLRVENYYPQAERWPFAPAEQGEDSFPAVQVRLETPEMGGRPMKRWVSSLPEFHPEPGPVAFEMLVLEEPSLLGEFLDPPTDVGPAGQLVLALGRGPLVRLDLSRLEEGKPTPIQWGRLHFTLKKRGHLMELLGNKPNRQGPDYPAVQFELSDGRGKGVYVACARLPHLAAFQSGEDVAGVAAWYHAPDFRWGQADRLGTLQFLRGPGDTLYFRVYGKDGLRQKGQRVDTANSEALALPWKPMDLRFTVTQWLPRAARREHVEPRHVEPGAEPAERLEPALRCVLENGGEARTILVPMGRVAQKVTVGREIFFLRYRMASEPVDFRLKLARATQVNDPGTARAAHYQSDVVVSGGREGKSEHRISMNEPLQQAGFKVYQTSYRPLLDPRTMEPVVDREGRPLSVSGLTLARDPGLNCKYAGSALLVLGIATMFWMRAYFFKPRSAV